MLSLFENGRYGAMHGFARRWAQWPGRSYRSAWLYMGRSVLPDELYSRTRKMMGRDFQPAWLKVDQLREAGVRFREERPAFQDANKGRRVIEELANSLQVRGLPHLLRHGDRNAMAFGREGRLPFLDYDLVDYCISLPDSAYVHNGWQKYVLRRAGEGLLPRQVQWRADKVGYAAPLDVWMRGALKDWTWDRLQATDVVHAPGFDRAAVQALWDEHQAGRANNSWALWRWISLGEWLAMHREGVWRNGL